MSAVQYPFIDIAVHDRVRDRFSMGEAVVLFSPDVKNPLWANGRGADLFGFSSIYDFLDQGPNRVDVAFRQTEAAARQLAKVGDIRQFTIRITSGFQRIPVQAVCELIKVQGETAVLFSAPVEKGKLSPSASAARMIEGFDDPDTHMAVIDANGELLAASPDFGSLGVSVQTARMMAAMAGSDPSRLVKRPIPTVKGYLPAAIAKLSDEPALHLLFTVETAPARAAAENSYEPRHEEETTSKHVGRDAAQVVAEGTLATVRSHDLPAGHFAAETAGAPAALDNGYAPQDAEHPAEPHVEPATVDENHHYPAEDFTVEAVPADGFADVITAVSEIEDSDEPEEEISLETGEMPQAPATEFVGKEPVLQGEPKTAWEPPADDVTDQAAESLESSMAAASDTETASASIVELPVDTAIEVPTVDEAQAPVIEGAAEEGTTPEPAGFVFRRDGRATRFVWKIDAEGRFSEVSNEFADAVGPHAADINGMAFTDLSALFHLDPDGKIAELLNKRDTWSGKTIWWPVEGTSLVVPVDLAALPTYTRTREFDGFRGFGIVRIGDAAEDPNAVGLSLTRSLTDDDTAPEAEIAGETAFKLQDDTVESDAAEDQAARLPLSEHIVATEHSNVSDVDIETGEAPVESELAAADQIVSAGTEFDEHVFEAPPAEETPVEVTSKVTQPSEEAAPDEHETSKSGRQIPSLLDWPAGERPALRIVENAGRRYSDKVIKLEEHRSNRRETLSPVEQAAFREIARQLDTFVGRNKEDGTPETPVVTETPAEPEVAATLQTPVIEPSEPVIEPIHEQHGLLNDNNDLSGEEETVEAVEEYHPNSASQPDSAEVGHAAEHGEIPEIEAEASDGHTVPEASAAFAAVHVEAEPTAEIAADPHKDLSDRELLRKLIPERERIGLSAEIIDQMPVALLVHSGDTLIHGNPEFLRLTGYPNIGELADIGGLDALLQRQDLEDKTAAAGGMVVVRADDVLVPVTARLQSVRWDDQTALMLALMPVAVDNQITSGEGEHAEVIPLRPLRPADQLARLQVEVEELRAILETATDGVVTLGANGDIRSMNRAASGLFNYDNEETTGQPFAMLFAHESQRQIQDYLGGLSGHGVASVLNDGREVIGREASGGFLPLFMTIGKLTSSNGYCAVIRDITQWKRTEDELRTAKRAAETANAHKSEFLAHVSHEIRTPLNAIIGFADMMALERFGPMGHPRYVEYSNDIGRSGRHVLDIVNDLLDISKIEAGEMELDFVAVGLNETVSEAVSLVQPQANGQRVIIRTALSHAVPQVVADLRSVKQIVLNILSNAIRFTPSGGQIVVSTAYETNGSVVLRIRDTGIGMTRSELELAMKPFRQVGGASRKRGDGTGLGLPLTKAMVDANRAAFAISSAPNEGTLVEISFPSPRVLAN